MRNLIWFFLGPVLAEVTPCTRKNVYLESGDKQATFEFSYDSDLKKIKGDLTCEVFWRVAKGVEISAEGCPSTREAMEKFYRSLKAYAHAVCMQDFVYYHKVLPYVQVGPNGFPLLWTRFQNNDWSVNEMKGDDFRSLVANLNLFVQIRVGKWGVNYGENARIMLYKILLVMGELIAPPTVGTQYSSFVKQHEVSHMSQRCKSLSISGNKFISWYSEGSKTINGYIECIGGTEVGRDGPNPFGYTDQFIQFTHQDGCLAIENNILQQLKSLAKTWCPSINPNIRLPVKLVIWNVQVYEFKHETPKGLVGFPIDFRVRDPLKMTSNLASETDLHKYIAPKFYVAEAGRFHGGKQVLVRVQRMIRDLQKDTEVSKIDFINSMASSILKRNVEDILAMSGGTLHVEFSPDGDFALVPL